MLGTRSAAALSSEGSSHKVNPLETVVYGVVILALETFCAFVSLLLSSTGQKSI